MPPEYAILDTTMSSIGMADDAHIKRQSKSKRSAKLKSKSMFNAKAQIRFRGLRWKEFDRPRSSQDDVMLSSDTRPSKRRRVGTGGQRRCWQTLMSRIQHLSRIR
eukprot:Gregarina_sp_Poly_1__1987@NODE_151_length_12545_cov_99_072047_g134_i0_p9_GENE_NODE_151_length_12545_cov_99_072047_g134_i0NODE_151_length_12545_cov_99_072047_g134_i0_p9_ORF_typecomplete_len105_score5_67_NODE_151_length_12545_cov_99_072047_g134_i070597373